MPSQQSLVTQNTFGDMLRPGEMLGKGNMKQSSNGTISRALASEYETIYFEWLSSMLLNLFTYENLPDTVNAAYLEYLLRADVGYAAVGLNQDNKLVVMNKITQPRFNQYGEYYSQPGNLGAWQSLYKKIIGEEQTQVFRTSPKTGEYVVFTNKYSTTGQFIDNLTIRRYAKDLAEIRALMQYNLNFQKTPIVFMGPRGALEADNIWDKIIGGDTMIKVSEKFDQSQIQALNLNVPLQTSEFKDAWNSIFAEFLTQFGINTVGVDKKERLVRAEAEGNNQLTLTSMNMYLQPRRDAVQLLNDRFGHNIKVSVNSETAKQLSSAMMGGGTDE